MFIIILKKKHPKKSNEEINGIQKRGLRWYLLSKHLFLQISPFSSAFVHPEQKNLPDGGCKKGLSFLIIILKRSPHTFISIKNNFQIKYISLYTHVDAHEILRFPSETRWTVS
jgi:hypothetical protein